MPILPRQREGLRGSSEYSKIVRLRRIRLHNISTQEEANRYLLEEFIPKHNRMFSHPAKEVGSAYRVLPKGLKLKDIFCLKEVHMHQEKRTVAGDNTISYKGKVYQILPNEYRISFVKAKVVVHEHLDGSVHLLMSLDLRHTHIFYQGKKLKHKLIAKEKIKEKRAHDYKLLTFLICIDIKEKCLDKLKVLRIIKRKVEEKKPIR